jgi:hypothetical protein
MAHFANIDENGIVTQVIVVNNSVLLDENNQEIEEKGIQFCKQIFGLNTNWIQTSYNSNFRGTFAGVGFTYNQEKDVFVPLKPYNSWILLNDGFTWVSPIPYPNDDNYYVWDENNICWILNN